MPARVVRGEFCSSESMQCVSIGAELTFVKLILCCDDFGRIDARLGFLKGQLFPMRESVTIDQLDQWLVELSTGDLAPIVRYLSGSRPYIQLENWEKHRGKSRRASESKLPHPPVRTNTPLPRKSSDCIAGDGRGGGVCIGVGDGRADANRHPSPKGNEQPTAAGPDQLDLPDEFWEKLASARPHGLSLTAQDVRDWFAMIWPQYSEYRSPKTGKPYSNHRSAVSNWWGRVREDEIEKSRERARTIEREVRDARIGKMLELEAAEREAASAGKPKTNHFAKVHVTRG